MSHLVEQVRERTDVLGAAESSQWRLGKAVDFGIAVQAVIFTEGSSQVQDWLLLDVTPVSV